MIYDIPRATLSSPSESAATLESGLAWLTGIFVSSLLVPEELTHLNIIANVHYIRNLQYIV